MFPTASRGTTIGFLTAAARLGGMVAPVVGQTLYELGDHELAYAILTGTCGVAAVCCAALAQDTAGASLPDNTAKHVSDDGGLSYSSPRQVGTDMQVESDAPLLGSDAKLNM